MLELSLNGKCERVVVKYGEYESAQVAITGVSLEDVMSIIDTQLDNGLTVMMKLHIDVFPDSYLKGEDE